MYSVEGISQRTVCLLSSTAGQSRMLNRALIIIAPALEAIEYQDIYFNGTLHYPSPYRGSPNDELDALWDVSATDFRG